MVRIKSAVFGAYILLLQIVKRGKYSIVHIIFIVKNNKETHLCNKTSKTLLFCFQDTVTFRGKRNEL